MPRSLRILLLATALAGTLGCVRGCTSSRPPIHPNPNMDSQPRYETQAASDFFSDGMTMRTPVPGTVARNPLPLATWTDSKYNTGRDAEGELVLESPVAVNDALLARGQDRFDIYCLPCHDRRGTGRGILFKRGNIPTTSIHLQRVRDAGDGELFDVITNGLGLMPSYGYPLSPADRWAIVAYVRKLQAEYDE